MHSQVRHAASVPQHPAHGGLESGQLLVKPRNTAHSAGAPMPVSPVTASDMDAMLAQLLPCTPQVNTDLLAGSLLLQPPLLAAEDDLPCSASVPDAPWWEHESLCGSEGPHSHECESASSRSSGGSSKRGRSPNNDMGASEDSAASHSPKQPRQAPLESQAGGSPTPVLPLPVVAQWGGEPADGLPQAMAPLRVAPMPAAPVPASVMDALLAQLPPCTPLVDADLAAGSLPLASPLLAPLPAAEDDLPRSASVLDANWWEHESLCGSEGPHSHECE